MKVNGTKKLNELTEAQVRREMERMDTIVRYAMTKRFHKGSEEFRGEPVTWNDPFEELAQREDEAIRDAQLDATESAQRIFDMVELPQPIVDRIRETALDQFQQYEAAFLDFLFAAGPHPLEVMRRLFAYTKKKRASLLCNMGFRQLGPLLRETHGAAHERCRVLFGELPAGWNKLASAVKNMKAAQMGNCNRKGGKKFSERE